jgi:hypothetical protein
MESKTMLMAAVVVIAIVCVFALRSCTVKQKSDDNKSSIKFELEKNKDK